MDTCKGFADGLIVNFRSLKIDELTNFNSFPPNFIEDRTKNYCFKVSLTNDLIYHLKHRTTQDKSNPGWTLTTTGNDPKQDWEDKTDKMCKKTKNQQKAFRKKHEIMDSNTIKGVLNILKKNDAFYKMLKKINRRASSLKWKDITKLSDWCTNANFMKKENACTDKLMELIKIIYDFKFFGINPLETDRLWGSTFAGKYVNILSSLNLDKNDSERPKVHLIAKSDVMIGPFYRILGIIPKRKSYLNAMKFSISRSKLPQRPQFLDNLITEVSKKGGKYFVRLIRDGVPLKIPACKATECELNDFITKTKSKVLNLSEVKKRCGAKVLSEDM